jgi:hypothetical protein
MSVIRCNAPLANGSLCQRRLHPGERCPDHGVLAPKDGSEPKPLEAKPCVCMTPIPWLDEQLEAKRCHKCGRTIEFVRRRTKRSRGRPSKPAKQKAASDPSVDFLPGDQLRLELDV